jgi:hypothetical protein
MPWERIREVMAGDIGHGFDADCFAALQAWRDGSELGSRVEYQLAEVDRLCSLNP